jgi:hypothetical protein
MFSSKVCISFNLYQLSTHYWDESRRFLDWFRVPAGHGRGAEPLAAETPGFVFELYPLLADGKSTLGTRIGFRVPSVDAAIAALANDPAALLVPATDSEWGRRAVVVDSEGHRVEILQ